MTKTMGYGSKVKIRFHSLGKGAKNGKIITSVNKFHRFQHNLDMI